MPAANTSQPVIRVSKIAPRKVCIEVVNDRSQVLFRCPTIYTTIPRAKNAALRMAHEVRDICLSTVYTDDVVIKGKHRKRA